MALKAAGNGLCIDERNRNKAREAVEGAGVLWQAGITFLDRLASSEPCISAFMQLGITITSSIAIHHFLGDHDAERSEGVVGELRLQ